MAVASAVAIIACLIRIILDWNEDLRCADVIVRWRGRRGGTITLRIRRRCNVAGAAGSHSSGMVPSIPCFSLQPLPR
jgi:hypothetical protein